MTDEELNEILNTWGTQSEAHQALAKDEIETRVASCISSDTALQSMLTSAKSAMGATELGAVMTRPGIVPSP